MTSPAIVREALERCRYCGGAGRFQIVSPVSDHAWADCFCTKPAALAALDATPGEGEAVACNKALALWEVLIELEAAETADRENEADSHCGAYGTSAAADYREQIRAKFEDIGQAYVAAFGASNVVEPRDCPRAPAPFRYCPDCDGSFPCEMTGGKPNG